jgi:hypothetical protein
MSAIWQPYWVKSTAYALTAVVIPTVFTGYTWRCTTAGTSAGTEPTWPDPTITPTITDGTVTWSVGTGFRQALQLGIKNVVQAFATANPTIIRSVRTFRPPSFAGSTSLPVFYLGDMSETITHVQGLRTRTFSGFSGYLVDQLGTIDDSNDRMNFAADVLTDLFTANYHAADGVSIFQHTATTDTEEVDGTIRYPALEFQFAQTEKGEGRI